jgi:hypothetical protein
MRYRQNFVDACKLQFLKFGADAGPWQLASGYWLLVSCLWLRITRYWMLVAGYWSLVFY